MDRRDGIRVFEDVAFQRRMTFCSVFVLVVGVLLLAPLSVALNWWGYGTRITFEVWPNLAVELFVLIASFVGHELIHGLFFKVFAPAGTRVTFGAHWKVGMLYACAEGIVYTRRQYQLIILAPTVVVSVLLLAGGVLIGHLTEAYLIAVVHLSGCTGDWGYLREIAQDASIDRCEDTTWGVRFYRAGDPAGASVPEGEGDR